MESSSFYLCSVPQLTQLVKTTLLYYFACGVCLQFMLLLAELRFSKIIHVRKTSNHSIISMPFRIFFVDISFLSLLAHKIRFDKQPNLDVTYQFKRNIARSASNYMFLLAKSCLHCSVVKPWQYLLLFYFWYYSLSLPTNVSQSGCLGW